jgi:hypothetical protein
MFEQPESVAELPSTDLAMLANPAGRRSGGDHDLKLYKAQSDSHLHFLSGDG